MPFPTPEDLPDPEIKPASLVSPALTGGFFTTVPPGKPSNLGRLIIYYTCVLYIIVIVINIIYIYHRPKITGKLFLP